MAGADIFRMFWSIVDTKNDYFMNQKLGVQFLINGETLKACATYQLIHLRQLSKII